MFHFARKESKLIYNTIIDWLIWYEVRNAIGFVVSPAT